MTVSINMSRAGVGNLSPAPTGYTRVTPNSCISNPRITVTQGTMDWTTSGSALEWDFAGSVLTPNNMFPSSATYVYLIVQVQILSSGFANTSNTIGVHSMYDATLLNFCDSFVTSQYETTAVTAGTVLATVSGPLICPIHSSTKTWIELIISGGASKISSLRIRGYYD